MTRRQLLASSSLPAFASAPAPAVLPRKTALCLNEDPNHYFSSRSSGQVTHADLVAWVDQYAGTQVRELLLCVNAQRTAFASKVWTSFWDGYLPDGPDDQPLFASLDPAARKSTRAWVHKAWQMNRDGLDHIRIWTDRAREKGLAPWLSIRMNDLHNVEDEQHPLHSMFWRKHPEFRRIGYRGEMRDKALDFNRPEVREYTLALVREVAERYSFDGLELDWMRHGYHFAPGREEEGRRNLNTFMLQVRRILGPRRRIGVRVPPHPESALRLGMDAVTWAQSGCADLVVPTNFWRTTDTAMPVRLWRQLLPSRTLLGAGLELGFNPFPGSRAPGGKPFSFASLETVRGAAAAYLNEGAERIYLFNYMDSQTAMPNLAEYPPVLHECGALTTLAGKPRRHLVTYTDTVAPGEAVAALLPAIIDANRWRAFRLAVGPADPLLHPVVRVGLSSGTAENCQVRLNGAPTALSGPAKPADPWPDCPVFEYSLSAGLRIQDDAVVELTASAPLAVAWVEVAFVAAQQR